MLTETALHQKITQCKFPSCHLNYAEVLNKYPNQKSSRVQKCYVMWTATVDM
jgi:hypothetical protein